MGNFKNVMAKLKLAFAILIVFIIILATNLIDKQYFERIETSIQVIYQDRLLAKDYLYRSALMVNEKEKMVLLQNADNFQSNKNQINDSISKCLTLFSTTNLTTKEKKRLYQLEDLLEELEQKEKKFFDSIQNLTLKESLVKEYNKTLSVLDELTQIQIVEGKRQVGIANKAIESSNMFSRLEIIVLVVLAIILQVLIFYKPKK